MSEKTNKMKIEKKLIAAIALIVTIGIATIIPLTFFMSTAKAQADEPWFNIDVSSAYLKVDVTDGYYNGAESIVIDALINSNGLSQHIDARVEYFEFTIYTNDIQLSKSYYYLGMDKPGSEPTPLPTFPQEVWYNIPWLNLNLSYINDFGFGNSGGMYSYNVTSSGLNLERWQGLGISSMYSRTTNEKIDSLFATLENTQTIYLDVKRTAYITFDGNNTVTTLTDDKVIQHIELTKNDYGEFIFGDSSLLRERVYQLDQSVVTPKNATSTTSNTFDIW